MGDRYGPMVVARRGMTLDELARRHDRRARAAHHRLSRPAALSGRRFRYVVVPFDQILDAVAAGQYEGRRVDAGLVIHEGQLTYAEQGLELVVDTGQWWFEQTGLPLPLGANAIRKDLGAEAIRDVHRLLRESIALRPGAPRRGAELRPEFRPRARSRQGRPVRRDVRQPVDAGFRPRRPARPSPDSWPKATRRA